MFTTTNAKDDMQTMRNSSDALRDDLDDTKTDLRTAAHKAGQTVRGYFDAACDNVSHGTETVTTQIRHNPVQSSMIALGVGFVLGALFRR